MLAQTVSGPVMTEVTGSGRTVITTEATAGEQGGLLTVMVRVTEGVSEGEEVYVGEGMVVLLNVPLPEVVQSMVPLVAVPFNPTLAPAQMVSLTAVALAVGCALMVTTSVTGAPGHPNELVSVRVMVALPAAPQSTVMELVPCPKVMTPFPVMTQLYVEPPVGGTV